MNVSLCPHCGSPNPRGSRFCARCGGAQPPARRPAPLGLRYTPLRFQVDPLSPPPQRDLRWIMIVLGGALLVLGILFFVVSAIVSTAVTAGGSACASPPCRSVDPGPWFAWLGLPFVLVGLGLLLVGLYWTIR